MLADAGGLCKANAALALGVHGDVYVASRDRWEVLHLTDGGSLIECWGANVQDGTEPQYPMSVGIGPDGTVYVADAVFPGPSVERFGEATTPSGRATTWGAIKATFAR